MERSGIETLLEAAALDAASFFNQPNPNMPSSSSSGPSIYEQNPRYGQQQFAPSRSVYSPANSPDTDSLYPSSFQKSFVPIKPQSSPYSPPDLPPRPLNETGETAKESDSMSEQVWDHCNLCTPATSPQGKVDWIECSVCQQWFHYQCVGLTSREAKNIDEFHCPRCSRTTGPSTLLRKSKRKHVVIDYLALHEGESLSLSSDVHPYCQLIQTREFAADNFQRISGHELTKEFANGGGVSQPTIIPHDRSEGLGISLPLGLTVRDVANMVGPESKVEVIDVPTQHESPNWDLQRWADYYEQPPEARDRVRNVISLEISHTKLGNQIQRPSFVRSMDLIQNWPAELIDKGEWPKVSLYCLMSVQNAYTDFHIDFGGSSVFYHIVEGSKVFLFTPPTPTNLSKYEHWCLSSDQSKIFFGDLVKECYKVQLSKGDTMIIPSGWIHAVYTPCDSLVIGGNFLTARDLSMEIKIAKIEKKTKVPQKFRFPLFSRLLWYSANSYLESRQNGLEQAAIGILECHGLVDLANYLHDEVVTALGQNDNATQLEIKTAKKSIPLPLKESVRFTKVFGNWVTSTCNMSPFKWAIMTEEELQEADKPFRFANSSNKRKRSSSSESSHTDIKPEPAPEVSSERLKLSDYSQAAVTALVECSVGVPTKEEKEAKDVAVAIAKPELSGIHDPVSIHPAVSIALPPDVVCEKPETVNSNALLPEESPEAQEVKAESEETYNAGDTIAPTIKQEGDVIEKIIPSEAGSDNDVPDIPNNCANAENANEDNVYSSDNLSEVSTDIDDDMLEVILGDERRKDTAIYQELMDLHNSRTRRSRGSTKMPMSAQDTNGKQRRHSHSGKDKTTDQKKSQRQRRKSTPGGNKAGQEYLLKTEPGLEETDESPVKRSRGRPRKNTDDLAPRKRNSESRQAKPCSSENVGAGDDDETMQRLIREAQLGIRSRR